MHRLRRNESSIFRRFANRSRQADPWQGREEREGPPAVHDFEGGQGADMVISSSHHTPHSVYSTQLCNPAFRYSLLQFRTLIEQVFASTHFSATLTILRFSRESFSANVKSHASAAHAVEFIASSFPGFPGRPPGAAHQVVNRVK